MSQNIFSFFSFSLLGMCSDIARLCHTFQHIRIVFQSSRRLTHSPSIAAPMYTDTYIFVFRTDLICWCARCCCSVAVCLYKCDFYSWFASLLCRLREYFIIAFLSLPLTALYIFPFLSLAVVWLMMMMWMHKRWCWEKRGSHVYESFGVAWITKKTAAHMCAPL